jgi:hypothetical protein
LALLFFSLEYQCSSEQERTVRMKNSLLSANNLLTQVIIEKLRMEGEFSDDDWLKSQGHSASASEHFADVLGSYAFAESLSRLSERWSRRKYFLASSSWQCHRPSLARSFPEEAMVERRFSLDSHASEKDRQFLSLSSPVRAALGCRKDFLVHECSLIDEAREDTLPLPSPRAATD